MSASDDLTAFLRETFHGIRLIPPHYDGAPFLRFEFGGDERDAHRRVEHAVHRASAVYEAVFGEDADGYVRAVVWWAEDEQTIAELLPADARSDLAREAGTNYYEDPDDDPAPYVALTASLRPREIDYRRLVRLVASSDMGIKPSLGARVYVVDRTEPAIFHMYDDRGGIVIAPSAASLEPLARRFDEWVIEDPGGRRSS